GGPPAAARPSSRGGRRIRRSAPTHRQRGRTRVPALTAGNGPDGGYAALSLWRARPRWGSLQLVVAVDAARALHRSRCLLRDPRCAPRTAPGEASTHLPATPPITSHRPFENCGSVRAAQGRRL